MARGLLGQNSDIQMRHNRRGALKDADLVILAGTVADFRLDYGKILSPNSKVIMINRDSHQLKKNNPLYWKSDHLVQADVGLTLVFVNQHIKALGWKGVSNEWIKKLRERDDIVEQKHLKKMEERPSDGNINPIKLLGALNKVSDKNISTNYILYRLFPKTQLLLQMAVILLARQLI